VLWTLFLANLTYFRFKKLRFTLVLRVMFRIN
jgi:hypothetical protein